MGSQPTSGTPVPANKREELHYILVAALGSTPVFYQPPESIRLSYPCVIYKRDKMDASYADDRKYKNTTRYQVTVIDQTPDSQIVQTIFGLPLCSHLRTFVADGLYHDIFELYF